MSDIHPPTAKPALEKLYEVVSNKFLTSTFNFSSMTNLQMLHLIQMIYVSMSKSQNAQYTKNHKSSNDVMCY